MNVKAVYWAVSLVNIAVGQLTTGDRCVYTKNNTTGICIHVTKCSEALNDIKQGLHPQRCSFDGLHVIACCPKPQKEVFQPRVLGQIALEKCKEYSQYVWTREPSPLLFVGSEDIFRHECPFNREELIVGGKKATRREFPHMVHIGYVLDNETVWACGGSLISNQFVLTAAHCLDSIQLQEAKFARMGITNQEDHDHIQVFDIVERIPYPEYHPKYHDYDIALVKLHKIVQLNTFVRPACLYTINSSPNSNVIANGWGDTYSGGDKSQKLQKAVLRLYDEKHCNKFYQKNKRLLDGLDDSTMICAGSSLGDKDTCQGDSGGPLQIYKENQKNMSCMYDIIGVTSFGVDCAIAPDVPSVYTRVSYFINWIEDVVWPPNENV